MSGSFFAVQSSEIMCGIMDYKLKSVQISCPCFDMMAVLDSLIF